MNRAINFASADRPEISLVPGEFQMTQADFRDIAKMLHLDAGIYITEAKATLVYSRLAKRLRGLGLQNFHDYCNLVGSKEGALERGNMLSALTTNVTHFFRERHHFDHLRDHVLPPLLDMARKKQKVRIWSAGCSTGEEAYSIALTILSLEPKARSLDIKILASDIDPNVTAAGRRGIYRDLSATEVPSELLRRYFDRTSDKDGEVWSVGAEPRGMISFRELNLNGSWPMKGVFHAIFCRNVIIYFDEATQHAVWSRFASKLSPGGVLYIGHSERLTGPATSSFINIGITSYRVIHGGAV